jgi:hypothetical protein
MSVSDPELPSVLWLVVVGAFAAFFYGAFGFKGLWVVGGRASWPANPPHRAAPPRTRLTVPQCIDNILICFIDGPGGGRQRENRKMWSGHPVLIPCSIPRLPAGQLSGRGLGAMAQVDKPNSVLTLSGLTVGPLRPYMRLHTCTHDPQALGLAATM